MKKLLIPILLLLVILSACKKTDIPPEVSPSPSPPLVSDEATPDLSDSAETPDASLPVEITFYVNTYELSPGLTLVAEASYPKTGISDIDSYYSERLAAFVSYAEGLVDDYIGDKPDSAVTQYDLHDSFEVVRNGGGIFSVHRTIYLYSGGAHGNHSDACENFTVDGARLTLADIFDATEDEYIEAILAEFEYFISSESENPDGYRFFDNALLWLRDEFPYNGFCIGDDGLIFYISPYYISAYAEGTIVIPIAWEDLPAARQEFTVA